MGRAQRNPSNPVAERRWVSLRSTHPTRCREALSPPAILPDLLADQAIDPRLAVLRRRRHDLPFRRAAGDFHQQFGADRFLELVAVLNGDDKGAGTADHAVLVI